MIDNFISNSLNFLFFTFSKIFGSQSSFIIFYIIFLLFFIFYNDYFNRKESLRAILNDYKFLCLIVLIFIGWSFLAKYNITLNNSLLIITYPIIVLLIIIYNFYTLNKKYKLLPYNVPIYIYIYIYILISSLSNIQPTNETIGYSILILVSVAFLCSFIQFVIELGVVIYQQLIKRFILNKNAKSGKPTKK